MLCPTTSSDLRALIAQACESAYRRGYQQAAVRSQRQAFTDKELMAIYDWRFLLPTDMAVPPPGDVFMCTSVKRLEIEQPEVLKVLEQ